MLPQGERDVKIIIIFKLLLPNERFMLSTILKFKKPCEG
jgi:hypothetical protein